MVLLAFRVLIRYWWGGEREVETWRGSRQIVVYDNYFFFFRNRHFVHLSLLTFLFVFALSTLSKQYSAPAC